MKFLGGMALDAAMSRIAGKAASSSGIPAGRVGGYEHAGSASRSIVREKLRNRGCGETK